MSEPKKFSPFTIGLAFFAMFFGSGNLVFPLFLGQYAGDHWFTVFLGFLLSGVIGPLFGVVAMVAYQGNTNKFFETIGKRNALIFVSLLMMVWIPFGAAPRCIRVAYESFATAVPTVPLWIFGIVYSALVYFSIVRKSRMIEVLGYFLTPALLICLAVLWVLGMLGTEAPPTSIESTASIFHTGLAHGYETMDLIASFFFSLSIIAVIQAEKMPVGQSMKKALLSGFIGMSILAMVYLALIYMAARNADLLAPLAKDQLLPFISRQFLGPQWSIIPVGVVFLACLTTSVAMLSVFADFVKEKYLPWDETSSYSVIIGVVLTYFLSLFTFDGLMVVTTPILEISCPLLILLTVYNLGKKFFFESSNGAPQVEN
ncbi:MAG: Branched-chain amino acid transport system 2 carrier protein [Chlamydiae bacterium]|nr:Branched-chain amino acid transport system 2 carrier protein [Chlamydiota bacterium]